MVECGAINTHSTSSGTLFTSAAHARKEPENEARNGEAKSSSVCENGSLSFAEKLNYSSNFILEQ